jgi:F-type H+-transporting ATPase subunit gamma
MAKDFSEGTIDTVYVVYNQFKSVLQQQAVEKKLLPLEDVYSEDPSSLVEYIFEPKEQEILDLLLPRYAEYETFVAILESTASEFAARMTAMDLATRNAKEMIEKLTLFFNRARQNAITRELMDIVGGAEALQK